MAQAFMSEEEIEDELGFQKALLISIDESVPDREVVLREVRDEIRVLEGKLKELRKPKAPVAKGLGNGAGMTPSNGRGAPARVISDPWFDNSTPSSVGTSNSPFTPNFDLPDRKRSHGDSLMTPFANKSRRTSASTSASTPTTSDEEFEADYKRRQEESIRRAAQEKADAELARSLQAEHGSSSFRPSQSTPSRSQTATVASTENNAFDRLLGRPSSQSQAGGSSSGSRLKTEDEHNLSTRPSVSTMPGAYPIRDDSDSDIEVISSTNFTPNSRSRAIKTESERMMDLAHRNMRQDAAQNRAGTPAGRSADAALSRAMTSTPNAQQNPGGISQRNLNRGAGWNPSHPSLANALSRPGFVVDGTSLPYTVSQPGERVYGNLPGHSRSFADVAQGLFNAGQESLSSIINRLPSYDPTTMVDVDGNPFSPGMMDDLDDYVHDPRKTEQELKELFLNISKGIDIPKENREGTPTQLKYGLYEHQKLALAWLKQMEEGTNKGGILADDMGLGKTISALALIHTRPSEDRNRKTTLIVGPVALIKQWEREIRTKTKTPNRLSTYVYHGSHKASFETLKNFDVVLTTYGTVGSEFAKYEKFILAHKADRDQVLAEENKRHPFLGPSSKWYRVILDEAQCIKNKNTKAAQGAGWIKATYRFCLTGTPMMNGVHELFSLIHFLRIKPYCEFKEFQKSFGVLTKANMGGSRKRAITRLQVLLKAIMLRRTKTSEIDGQPILQLPPKTEMVDHVVFDESEQEYYTALETKARIQFNKYQRAGTIGKNYSNILVWLLRLRQAACHPHLIMDFDEAPADLSHEEMDNLAKQLGEDVVRRIKEAAGEFECPICYDAADNVRFIVPCGHDTCAECLASIIATATGQGIIEGIEGGATAKCPACRGQVTAKSVIDYQTFKHVHMGEAREVEEEQSSDEGSSDESDEDDDAGIPVGDEALATASDNNDEDDDGDLSDFVVPDDAPLDEGEAVKEEDGEEEDDDLDVDVVPVAAPKITKRKRAIKYEESDPDSDFKPKRDNKKSEFKGEAKNEVKNEEDSDIASDDVAPSTKAKGKGKAKATGKGKGKGKAPAKDADDPDDESEGLPDIGELGHDDQERDIASFFSKKMQKNKKRKVSSRSSKVNSGKSKKDKKAKKPKKVKKGVVNIAMLKKNASRSAKARRKYMRYLESTWIPSAKTAKCIEILEAREKGVKTIVFSQFTTLLDLIEIPVKATFGQCYRRYDGSMSTAARNQSVVDFTDDRNVNIMLVSLKAGNAGLNLVAASEVIILDPFWNPYIEMQAIDRAYRIGQQKPVTVHRILVKRTVEDRILSIQNRKRELVDAALDEKESAGVAKLSHKDLAYLFKGNDDEDEERETRNRPSHPALGAAGPSNAGGIRLPLGVESIFTGQDSEIADL